jgi:hypothetical protein
LSTYVPTALQFPGEAQEIAERSTTCRMPVGDAAFAGNLGTVARQPTLTCAAFDDADIADPAATSSSTTPATTPTAPRLVDVPRTAVRMVAPEENALSS